MFINVHAIVAQCAATSPVIAEQPQVKTNATERDSERLRCSLVIDEAGEIETHELFIDNCDNYHIFE